MAPPNRPGPDNRQKSPVTFPPGASTVMVWLRGADGPVKLVAKGESAVSAYEAFRLLRGEQSGTDSLDMALSRDKQTYDLVTVDDINRRFSTISFLKSEVVGMAIDHPAIGASIIMPMKQEG